MTRPNSVDANVPVIDRSALEAIVEIFGVDDPGAILDLLDTFLVESIKQVEEMRIALAASDWIKLHRMAHSLKSSSATFGASRLSQLSAWLEQAAKGQCAEGECAELVGQVQHEHQLACAILEAERASLARA
jgi:HPt (histidine-containing phosphotransfer) domain-containing protein